MPSDPPALLERLALLQDAHTAAVERDLAIDDPLVNPSLLAEAIAEIERLTEERDGLRELLREVSDKGLIYWEPQTTSGAVNRALMFAKIERALAPTPPAAARETEDGR